MLYKYTYNVHVDVHVHMYRFRIKHHTLYFHLCSREENLPPQSQSDDQPVPKSLLRLLNPKPRMKKIPQKQASSGETKREAVSKSESQEQVYSRREGESLKSYLDRVDAESRARLVVLSKKSKGTSERRKKYGILNLHLICYLPTHVLYSKDTMRREKRDWSQRKDKENPLMMFWNLKT